MTGDQGRQDVCFDRVDVRYRVAGGGRVSKPRLDRDFVKALEGVDGALRDRGVDLEECVCVRRLRVAQRLRLGDPARLATGAWTADVADAIVTTVAAGGPNVVRYRSRRHALADMVLSAAAGNVARAWAWAQLGLWSRGETADQGGACAEALRLLADDPPAIVPVLVAAEAAGRLDALLERGRDAHWTALARAAGWAGRRAAAPSSDHAHEPALARRLAGSRLAAAARRRGADLSGAKRQACAALALAEIAPELALAASPARVATAERLLRTGADAAPDAPAESGQGLTRWGGLPMLLHLVRALGLPAEVAADPRLGRRTLREVLARLANLLVPELPPRDPAALAFAGLPPSADPPPGDAWQTGQHDDEDAAVASLADRLTRALVDRLDREPRAALAFVIERPATVIADPGWLEIRFPLDQVSVELRRAALDLHPDWLPFLGVVMRFVYV